MKNVYAISLIGLVLSKSIDSLDGPIASIDFSGKLLKEKNFYGQNIFDAKFIGADLTGANFTKEGV